MTFAGAAHFYRDVARRRTLAVLIAGLAPMILRLALLPVLGVPEPMVHDEFSYLLAGDTFALGRLANPSHPAWPYLETFHVLVQPAYASKYPPAQGLMLALGQRIAGIPWLGVWLSAGLMCAACCWMLQGWLPAHWALTGALLAGLRVGTFSYWMNSYWGGAVAACAGALVLGAVPRWKRRPSATSAAVLAAGVSILAISRPFEGAALSAGALVCMALAARSRRFDWLRVCVPAVGVLAAAALAMLVYNWRVTGDPLVLPYVAHERIYGVAPAFLYLVGPQPEPAYRSPELRHFWVEWDVGLYRDQLEHRWQAQANKLLSVWVFFLGVTFLVPFVAGVVSMFRGPQRWTLGVLSAAGSAPLLLERFALPHYVAPLTALIFLAVSLGLRSIRRWRPQGIPAGPVVLGTLALSAVVFVISQFPYRPFLGHPEPFRSNRREVLRVLGAAPGKHLVIVRYTPEHDIHTEWVYNAADIDGAKVVWARELGPETGRELAACFQDRDFWLLEPDLAPVRLRRLSADGEALKVPRASADLRPGVQ